jgi:hypothetical protein
MGIGVSGQTGFNSVSAGGAIGGFVIEGYAN